MATHIFSELCANSTTPCSFAHLLPEVESSWPSHDPATPLSVGPVPFLAFVLVHCVVQGVIQLLPLFPKHPNCFYFLQLTQRPKYFMLLTNSVFSLVGCRTTLPLGLPFQERAQMENTWLCLPVVQNWSSVAETKRGTPCGKFQCVGKHPCPVCSRKGMTGYQGSRTQHA